MFAHHFNKDNANVYIDAQNGTPTWLLPEVNLKSAVIIVSHLTDEGEVYFEDTLKKSTHWVLPPGLVSKSTEDAMKRIRKLSTPECEQEFQSKFNYQLSLALFQKLESVLDIDEDIVVSSVDSVTQYTYVHHLTKDNVAFYLCIETSSLRWLLPKKTNLKLQVRIISHFTDEGEIFYEDVASKKTLWAIPPHLLNPDACANLKKIRNLTRAECEKYMVDVYDSNASQALQDELDSAMSDTDHFSDEEASSPVVQQPSTKKKSISLDSWRYIRHLTKENIPIYIDMQTGSASWLLADNIDLKATVRLLSHVTEEGDRIYFEDLATEKTSWSLPAGLLSPAAMKMMNSVREMSSSELNVFLKQEYNPRASAILQNKLDTLIELSSDDEQENDVEAAIDIDQVKSPSRRMSRFVTSSYISKMFGQFDANDIPVLNLEEGLTNTEPNEFVSPFEGNPMTTQTMESFFLKVIFQYVSIMNTLQIFFINVGWSTEQAGKGVGPKLEE